MTVLAGIFMPVPPVMFGWQWFTPMGLGIIICCGASSFCQAGANGLEQ